MGTSLQWVQIAVVVSQQWVQTEVVASFLCGQTVVGASLLAMCVACGLCSSAQRAKTRHPTLICGNQAWMFEGLNLRFDFAQVGHDGLRIQ